jgi:uncharacterized protein YqgC (DUF456 family)
VLYYFLAQAAGTLIGVFVILSVISDSYSTSIVVEGIEAGSMNQWVAVTVSSCFAMLTVLVVCHTSKVRPTNYPCF